MAAREGRLRRRPSSKAASIRRGKLQISSPILLSGTERNNSGLDLKDVLVPEQSSAPLARQQQNRHSRVSGTDGYSGMTIETGQREHHHPNLLQKKSAGKLREPSALDHGIGNQGPESGQSASLPLGPTSDNSKRKSRGTSLRTVFKRMFGGKGKPEAKETPSSSVEQGYYSQDFQASSAVAFDDANKETVNISRNRSASLPTQEYDSPRAAGQNLPFPMNVNAPEGASSSRGYPAFDLPIQGQHRRNSLPSVLFTSGEAAILSNLWSASSNRVTSADDQNLRLPIAENEIGVAVTSGSSHNRRSRSAGALHDLANSKAGYLTRTMSDEIRHWRESYSTRAGNGHEVLNVPEVAVEEQSDDSLPPVEDTLSAGQGDQSHVKPRASLLEAGPETQSPGGNVHTSNDAILDRVARLERDVRALEQSVQKLIGRTNRQTIILQEVPQDFDSDRPREFIAEKSPTMPSYASLSPSPAPPFVPPPSPIHQSRQRSQHRTHSRGSSERVENVTTYSSVPVSQAPTSPDAVSALYLLLSHERTSRKNLEMYMQSLQRELLDMRSMMIAGSEATPQLYPSSSRRLSDMTMGTHTQHVDDRRQTSRFSQFDSGDDDEEGDNGEGSSYSQNRTSFGQQRSSFGQQRVSMTSVEARMGAVSETADLGPDPTGGDPEAEEIYETPLEEPYESGWAGVGETHARHMGMV